MHKDRYFVEASPAAREPRITSVPFVYEEPSARLKLLREQYQLDMVIAPGRTEMEQLMLLRSLGTQPVAHGLGQPSLLVDAALGRAQDP